MTPLDAYGAVPLPDFPRFPADEGFDSVLTALVVATVVLSVALLVWYIRDDAPEKAATPGLVLLLTFTIALLGMAFYDTRRDDARQVAMGVVTDERDVISAQTAQAVADWYGVFPIEIRSESVTDSFLPAFFEMDGLVPTDCYTLVRDGRLGIACGPEPESYEEALATLVELPRADERRVAAGGGS